MHAAVCDPTSESVPGDVRGVVLDDDDLRALADSARKKLAADELLRSRRLTSASNTDNNEISRQELQIKESE